MDLVLDGGVYYKKKVNNVRFNKASFSFRHRERETETKKKHFLFIFILRKNIKREIMVGTTSPYFVSHSFRHLKKKRKKKTTQSCASRNILCSGCARARS